MCFFVYCDLYVYRCLLKIPGTSIWELQSRPWTSLESVAGPQRYGREYVYYIIGFKSRP